ncbi:MAG TPA: hypothetical protein VH916_03855 [Dehalococcoidia bacterium]
MCGTRRSRRGSRSLRRIGTPLHNTARGGRCPSGAALLPPVWTAVLARLGSGASLPVDEIEPWARAVTLAQLLVQQTDAVLGDGRPQMGAAIAGLVARSVAPAVLAWLETAPAVETVTEVRQ